MCPVDLLSFAMSGVVTDHDGLVVRLSLVSPMMAQTYLGGSLSINTGALQGTSHRVRVSQLIPGGVQLTLWKPLPTSLARRSKRVSYPMQVIMQVILIGL